MRLIGHYNELEYRITDIDTDTDMYRAGNNPNSSYTGDTVPADQGVGIESMKRFTEQTGKDIARENSCQFLGIEYEPVDE